MVERKRNRGRTREIQEEQRGSTGSTGGGRKEDGRRMEEDGRSTGGAQEKDGRRMGGGRGSTGGGWEEDRGRTGRGQEEHRKHRRMSGGAWGAQE